MKKNNVFLGIFLLAMGGLALLNNLGVINYSLSVWRLWPLSMIIPGLMFELAYFNNDGSPGLLVPGGILLTQGLLFMFCSFFGYGHLSYLWPLFIGSVGIGLFQLYYFGGRERALFYVSSGFLGFTMVSIFFSMLSIKGNYIFPIILILLGAFMLYKPNKDKPIVTVEYDKEEDA